MEENARRDAPIVELAGVDGAGKSTVAQAVAEAFGWPALKFNPFPPAFHATLGPIRDRFGQRHVDAARALALGICVLQETSTQAGPAVYDRHLESALMWWSVMGISPLPQPMLDALPRPDLVILLDVDPAVASGRMLESRIETPQLQRWFSESCARYLRAAAREKGWVVVDAGRPLPEVCDVVLAEISGRLRVPYAARQV
ncbi:MAG TPA: hypothetical protein VFB84_16895 [Micromonosporaceae bacterium]|nr:hypothetical protein [Micromonosporaceae bacterium]